MSKNHFPFLFDSFDTSSTAMNFTLFQLATHQDIQEKARREIEETIEKHNGKLSYEALMEMEYLNQVFNGEIHESLEFLILIDKIYFRGPKNVSTGFHVKSHCE